MASRIVKRDNWRNVVMKADEDFTRESRIVKEYTFSNERSFERRTDRSGAYTPEDS